MHYRKRVWCGISRAACVVRRQTVCIVGLTVQATQRCLRARALLIGLNSPVVKVHFPLRLSTDLAALPCALQAAASSPLLVTLGGTKGKLSLTLSHTPEDWRSRNQLFHTPPQSSAPLLLSLYTAQGAASASLYRCLAAWREQFHRSVIGCCVSGG